MLSQQARAIRTSLIWFDMTVITFSLIIAHAIGQAQGWNLNSVHQTMWILVLALPVWHFFLMQQGLYGLMRCLSVLQLFTKLIKASLMSAALVIVMIYFFQAEAVNPKLFFLFALSSFLFLALYRTLGLFVLSKARVSGYNLRKILIVGSVDRCKQFNQLLVDHGDVDFDVVGFIQIDHGDLLEKIDDCPVLGRDTDVVEVCKQYPVDEVFFFVSADHGSQVDHSLNGLKELGVTARMVVDFWSCKSMRKELSLLHDELPIITLHTKTIDVGQLFLKRMLDLLGACAGLLLTALLLPFIAVAIKRSDPGPLLFSQERVGESGRRFRCWKFRSMYIDAEERKKELMARNEMSGAIFKIKDDPRIFPFGNFLRKTSLDELPQFWNVFKGEMSLVGTRPPTPDEVENYENWHRRRISIKPGITGLWQVSGRNEIDDFDEIVRLDLHYIDNWSIWYDIQLLLKTIKVVLVRDGSR